MSWYRSRRLLGPAFLFSGIALLIHIFTAFPLPLALAMTSTGLVAWWGFLWYRMSTEVRAAAIARLRTGIIAGIVATIAYDIAKWALSLFDPSPYNPFEALHTFGTLLMGPDVGTTATLAAGASFHFLNGIAFATAFVFLFAHRGVLAAVGWGIFLELFQLTLYPGWLDIRLYQEFATISFLGHVVYGLVLGYVAQWLLVRE